MSDLDFPETFVFLCGAHMDQISTLSAPSKMGVSNPAMIEVYPGGAALNSASIAAKLGLKSVLLSPIGHDAFGEQLIATCAKRGITPKLIKDDGHPTGIYSAIFEPDGDIVIGAADLEIYKTVNIEWIDQNLEAGSGLFVNANLETQVLRSAIKRADFVAAATISPAKAPRLLGILDQIDLLFTNAREAEALSGISPLKKDRQAEWFITKKVPSGIISDGNQNLICWNDGTHYEMKIRPLPKNKAIVDVNGAGDALAGGILAGLGRGLDFESAIKIGLATAAFSLSHKGPYSDQLSFENLKD